MSEGAADPGSAVGNDPAEVREQYADPSRLATRASFWATPAPDKSPQDRVIAALRAAGARRVLEIGCGRGAFAARMAAELGVEVIATDQSDAMVAAAAAQGVIAERADACELPYPDAGFDAVVALWMLYHVPDLDRALAEVRRVLRPGGVFVAVTNGREHTADLRAAAGLGPAITTFMAEDGATTLERHFDHVDTEFTAGRAVADHATARAYLASFAPDAAARLAPYDGLRTWHGSGAVFVAR